MQHKWGKDFCTAVCRLIFFLILFMDVHPKATGLCTATTPKRLRMATTPSSWIAGKLRATSSSSWPRSAGAAEASRIMHFSLGYFKGYILWLFGFNHFNLAHCEIHHCFSLSLTCCEMLVCFFWASTGASKSCDPGESFRGSDAPRPETCAGELHGRLLRRVKLWSIE